MRPNGKETLITAGNSGIGLTTALLVRAKEQRLRLSDETAKPLTLGAIPTAYGVLSLQQLWEPGALMGFKGEQALRVTTLNGSLCLLDASQVPLPNFLKDMEFFLRSASDQ